MKQPKVNWETGLPMRSCGQIEAKSRRLRHAGQLLISLSLLTSSGLQTSAQQLVPSPDVAESGKFSIANTVDYAPFGYLDADGKPTGIIVELATATASLLGAELEIQRTPFTALMPGLSSGRFKVAWETFSITPERLEHVDFIVFLQGGLAVSTRPDRRGDLAGEWGLCGKQIGVSAGSASDFLVDQLAAWCTSNGAPSIEKSVFNTSQDIIQAVLSGRIDARVDDATASSYFETVSHGTLVVLPTQYDVTPQGLAIAKGDTETAQMIAKALAILFDNGTYADILERYGMSAHAVAQPYLVDSIDDLRNQ